MAHRPASLKNWHRRRAAYRSPGPELRMRRWPLPSPTRLPPGPGVPPRWAARMLRESELQRALDAKAARRMRQLYEQLRRDIAELDAIDEWYHARRRETFTGAIVGGNYSDGVRYIVIPVYVTGGN